MGADPRGSAGGRATAYMESETTSSNVAPDSQTTTAPERWATTGKAAATARRKPQTL